MKQLIGQFFLTNLRAGLFILLCFTSVSSASVESSADVHFCLPLDFEDMRARDSIYAARKHAYNLDVGPPRTVRLIYFLPNDRPFRQEVVDSMKTSIRRIQTFYADQMEARGYGGRAFRFETDAEGDPLVHRIDGQYPDSHYLDNTSANVLDEVEQVFDTSMNIYFMVIDNSINAIVSGGWRVGGVGRRRGKNGGVGLFSGEFSFRTAAHELGHAFGLRHNFYDDAYIMSYGPGEGGRSLSACNAEYLAVHPHFNLDIPIEEEQQPTIERISPNTYPTGTARVSIQLKVSDSEGLHQVILFVQTREPHFSAGAVEVKACLGLARKKDTVIEFDYDGIVPSVGGTSLSNPVAHPIFVEVVDTDGNASYTSLKLRQALPQYIATLDGHTDRVPSMSFSPDGTILASASWDGAVKLWDVSTKENIATLEGQRGSVYSVSFSPDGTILASGNADGTVELWDVVTKENIAAFKNARTANSVVFSPDGTILATGTYGVVELWDVSTRANIATLEGHKDWVSSISFSPDGTILASASWDSTIKLWDISTRANIATFEGHTSGVNSVIFSPDGTTLASGSPEGTVKLWDVSTRANIATLKERYVRTVWSVAFSPDGITLVSTGGSQGEKIRLWDIVTRHNIATLEMLEWVNSVVYSPDGATLAAGLSDGTIELLDTSEWMRPRAQTLVKISGDNQQGTLGAGLANPHVVEVRDQNGSVLPGVQVTFSIIAGTGKLSGRFTVEHAITDANGRAARTLIPGLGTNIVEVSVAGLAVEFDALGVVPARPIRGSGYQTWHLPDGALIRLGKGDISNRDKAVAFSPDGQRLAVASGIGVWLYDVATFRERALLTGHTRDVNAVSFSPDGTMLATGSSDGTVRLWDVATEREIATFEGHRHLVYSVSFSPDGTMLASAGGYGDHAVKLWDIATEREIATFEGHRHLVYSVSFSPDGTMLASAGGYGDHAVKLWDIATQKNIATLEGHASAVISVSFSPDGTMLATGSSDGTVRLWDVATQKNIATLRYFLGVTSVSFSPDGTTLAAASYREIRLWDVERKIYIDTYMHTSRVHSAVFSLDGAMLAMVIGDGTIRVRDIETQNRVILKHQQGVTSVSFSPDGITLAAGLNLWDIETGIPVTTFEEHTSVVSSVAFSPDGLTLASGSGDRTVKLWDVATGEHIAIFEGHEDEVNSVMFSPDGAILVSGSGDRTVKLWDVSTKEHIVTLDEHKNEVKSVSFSPDGLTLASGSKDGAVLLWDILTGEHIAILEGGTGEVSSVSFSPDGTTLAAASYREIRLWDVLTKTNIATLEGHRYLVYSIAFSPDGAILASGSEDKTVKLWDVETGRSIATFEGHTEGVYSLGFSIDGTTLASGSADGTVLLWDVSQYVTPVAYISDANLRAVIRSALGKSGYGPITREDLAGLTTLDASNRNIRELDGLEFATNLTELNLTGNPLSSLSLNTHIPALQNRGVEVLFDKPLTPDFDGDGAVGFADFLFFVAQFGFSGDDEGYDARFDLDGDGTIGFGDFLIFANAFGSREGSGG